MPASVVVELKALTTGSLLNSNGLILHAAWFKAWAEFDKAAALDLHNVDPQKKPFTISPLMDLMPDPKGIYLIKTGQRAWFRITTLTDELTDRLPVWVNGIKNAVFDLKKSLWQVERVAIHSDEHKWSGRISYEDLFKIVQSRLADRWWTLEFATPTTFNGRHFTYPFPQPESLVRSWLNRWQSFAPMTLPDNLPDQAREFLAIEKFKLQTKTVRMRGETLTGCVGEMTLHDRGMTPEMRQTLDLLIQYSFFCGSGYKTTQGLGQTRLKTKP